MTNEYKNFFNFLENLIKIPSPSGFTENATNFIIEKLNKLGFKEIEYDYRLNKSEPFGNQYFLTPIGELIIEVKGQNQKSIAITSHIDTIGATLSHVEEENCIRMIPIGSVMISTTECHYCQIFSNLNNRFYIGTIQCEASPYHLNKESGPTTLRTLENMYIKLDHKDAKTVVSPGDYIAFDPNYRINYEDEIIASRFLDNKTGVSILLENIRRCIEYNAPQNDTYFIISNFEELSHQTICIPHAQEYINIDAKLVGKNLPSDIYTTYICTSDSASGYHKQLTERIINLAKTKAIKYKNGHMKNYGTETSLAIRNGNLRAKAVAFGPGVDWMHAVERTSFDAIINTMELLWAYLTTPETT